MKHDELRSVAHNVATSLAGGCSFLVGVYDLNVLAAVRQAPGGEVIVDFMRGTVTGAPPSSEIARVVARFPAALPDLCAKHGIPVSAFHEMTARYWAISEQLQFVVTIVDQTGRTTKTEYGGYNGQRTKVLDSEGRLRPKPIKRA